jgi:hypothetical protein
MISITDVTWKPHPPAPSPAGEGEQKPNIILFPSPAGEGLGVRALLTSLVSRVIAIYAFEIGGAIAPPILLYSLLNIWKCLAHNKGYWK